MSVKNDDIDEIVKEVRKVGKKITIIVLNMPEMDTKNPTELEKYIIEHKSSSEVWLASTFKQSKMPHELENLGYSIGDFVEMLTPPEQLLVSDHLVLSDKYGKNVNIRNGSRITVNQPSEYAQTIWFTGGCYIYGIGNEDAFTIESYLQNKINSETKFKTIVRNYGQLYGGGGKKYMLLPHILDVIKNYAKDGDILIIGGNFPIPKRPNFHIIESQTYFKKPYKYGEVFFEVLPHLNRNGNHLVADCVFDYLISKKLLVESPVSVANEEIIESHPVLKDEQFMSQLEEYKSKISQFKHEGRNGGICMNANPFTYGHRYLVDTASKQVDHLYIFVAEENRTFFPFKDRFQMIKDGVKDFKNVTVIPGGIFVGSIITFPEYYDREVKKEVKILPSLDLLIFSDHLCPTLNIKVRFVGTEPICQVTNQYNDQLKKILPEKGIQLVEIPRKQNGNEVVSASYVRDFIKRWQKGEYKAGDLEHFKQLVPPTTFEHIEKMYSDIFPKK